MTYDENITGNSWSVTVFENADGELVLPFPDSMILQLGWQLGDELEVVVDGNSASVVNCSYNQRNTHSNR